MKRLFGTFLLTIIWAFAAPTWTTAQDANAPQDPLIKTVDSSLYLIRMEYVLRSADSINYGRNGREYFSRLYGIAVLSKGQLYFDNRLLQPWLTLDSANYNMFKDSSLTPIATRFVIRSVLSSQFKDLLMQDQAPADYQVFKMAMPADSLKSGIDYIEENRSTDGFLVVVTAENDLEMNDTGRLQVSIYRPRITYRDSVAVGEIPLLPVVRPVGGAYFSVKPAFGNLEVFFSGLLFQKRLSSFYVVPLRTKRKEMQQVLTPVTPNKEPKQSDLKEAIEGSKKKAEKKGGKREHR